MNLEKPDGTNGRDLNCEKSVMLRKLLGSEFQTVGHSALSLCIPRQRGYTNADNIIIICAVKSKLNNL